VVSWSKCPSTLFTCSPEIFAPMSKEIFIDVFKDYWSCKLKTFTKLEKLKLNVRYNVGNAPM
jgi:hypothetical protein